jgi:hypothetical protein
MLTCQPYAYSAMKEFAENLFTIRRDQVDLKYIFDYFRNYLICGALFYAGNVLITRGAVVSKIPYFGFVAGWFFQVLAFVLFSLNFTHGQFAIRALAEKPIYRWLFIVINVFFFFALQELVAIK